MAHGCSRPGEALLPLRPQAAGEPITVPLPDPAPPPRAKPMSMPMTPSTQISPSLSTTGPTDGVRQLSASPAPSAPKARAPANRRTTARQLSVMACASAPARNRHSIESRVATTRSRTAVAATKCGVSPKPTSLRAADPSATAMIQLAVLPSIVNHAWRISRLASGAADSTTRTLTSGCFRNAMVAATSMTIGSSQPRPGVARQRTTSSTTTIAMKLIHAQIVW